MMNTLDLRTCVINCETLREQLNWQHWGPAERTALEANQRIAINELRKARAELLADGFSKVLVDTMQQQFVMEYMEGTRK